MQRDGIKAMLYGTGENVRDWIHADDHSSAVLAIIERGRIGETYPIGADGELSNREIIEMILTAFGYDADDFEHVTDRVGHDLRYAIDSSKLRSELGWLPGRGGFEAGLASTIDWYKSWWRPQKSITENKYAKKGQ